MPRGDANEAASPSRHSIADLRPGGDSARNRAGSRVSRTARAFNFSAAFAAANASSNHEPTNPVPPSRGAFADQRPTVPRFYRGCDSGRRRAASSPCAAIAFATVSSSAAVRPTDDSRLSVAADAARYGTAVSALADVRRGLVKRLPGGRV